MTGTRTPDRTRLTALALIAAELLVAVAFLAVASRGMGAIEHRRTAEAPRLEAVDAASRARELVVWGSSASEMAEVQLDDLAVTLVTAWDLLRLPAVDRGGLLDEVLTGPALEGARSHGPRHAGNGIHRVEIRHLAPDGSVAVLEARTLHQLPDSVRWVSETSEVILVSEDGRWLVRSFHRAGIQAA